MNYDLNITIKIYYLNVFRLFCDITVIHYSNSPVNINPLSNFVDWASVHRKQSDKVDGLDTYLEKKEQRRLFLTATPTRNKSTNRVRGY